MIRKSLAATAVALGTFAAGTADAQPGRTGQPQVFPRPTGQPQVFPQAPRTGQPQVFPQQFPQFPPPNPVVLQTPTQLQGAYIDPATGRVIVNTGSTTVQQSALNPYRQVEVPGTRRWVDRTEYDAANNPVRVTGWEWQSVTGQWHGDLNRQTVTVGPGGTIVNDNQTHYRSAPTTRPGTTPASPPRTGQPQVPPRTPVRPIR